MNTKIAAMGLLIWIQAMVTDSICSPIRIVSDFQTSQPALINANGAKTELTGVIKSILSQGGWEGKEVVIIGYYRG